MPKKLLLLFSFICFTHLSIAQETDSTLTLKLGSSFFINPDGVSKSLPFWMHANKDGKIDQNSANALGYLQGEKTWYQDKSLGVKTGANLIARYSEDQALYFNELYARADIFNFVLSAGKFIDPLALKEDDLSSGSFIISRNTNPIPKVAFHTNGFVGVPGTNGIVRYNGFFGHGWFDDERFVDNAYLHQKYFYLNIKYAFFDAVGGIIHNVQWAGESQSSGKLPSGWKTFTEVVFARGSSNDDAPGGEKSNAVGNSVAGYDFSLGLQFPGVHARAYRLFYLEDKVSTRFRSPWDGIWGLVLKPDNGNLIQTFLWEHINTKRQDSFDFEPRGTASYYNNGIYRTGWTYNGRVIGNPLLLTDGGINRPVYNNIIIGHHFGLGGSLAKNVAYSFKYTFTRNYGERNDQIIRRLEPGSPIRAELRPLEELKKVNHSLVLEVQSAFPKYENLRYGVMIASDFGELYGDRIGFGFKVEYQILN